MSGRPAARARNCNMETSLADQDRAITILPVEDLLTPVGPATDPVPTRSPRAVSRRAASSRSVAPRKGRGGAKSPDASGGEAPEAFFRDLVWNLRNGVLAVTVDGRIAVMNDVAYRILGLPPRRSDIGRPFTGVLQAQPEVARIIARAFELEPPAEPRRAAAQEQQEGHRLHHLAGARLAEPRHRRDAVLQGPHPGRAARGTRAAARPARRARRDGGGDRARGQEPARRHRSHGRHSQAHSCRTRRTRRRSSATSSRKPRWPTPSSSRCSTSCVRSGCRSSTCR